MTALRSGKRQWSARSAGKVSGDEARPLASRTVPPSPLSPPALRGDGKGAVLCQECLDIVHGATGKTASSHTVMPTSDPQVREKGEIEKGEIEGECR